MTVLALHPLPQHYSAPHSHRALCLVPTLVQALILAIECFSSSSSQG